IPEVLEILLVLARVSGEIRYDSKIERLPYLNCQFLVSGLDINNARWAFDRDIPYDPVPEIILVRHLCRDPIASPGFSLRWHLEPASVAHDRPLAHPETIHTPTGPPYPGQPPQRKSPVRFRSWPTGYQ